MFRIRKSTLESLALLFIVGCVFIGVGAAVVGSIEEEKPRVELQKQSEVCTQVQPFAAVLEKAQKNSLKRECFSYNGSRYCVTYEGN